MDPFDRILGHSRAAFAMRSFGRRAAAVDAPVLLTGETGTGKSLLARAIHDASERRRRPFVVVNCAGIAATLFESEFFGHRRGAFSGALDSHRGLLEQADRGTLLLDELVELRPRLQAKLLTALESGEIRRVGGERTLRVDARVIAATNDDLDRAVRDGRFRRDLYHRLLVLSFRLPALRERDDDIGTLARSFLRHAAARYRRPVRDFLPATLDRIRAYSWPGNVRELAHAIEAAVLACDRAPSLAPDHLPRRVLHPPAPDPPASPDQHPADRRRRYSFYGSPDDERRHIEAALRAHRGNKTRAARALGMARNTLRDKIRRLDIPDPGHPHDAGANRSEPRRSADEEEDGRDGDNS
ncbi:MAG: sigma-54 interaction domain-containing protein [Gemmatimonadota bacterium]